jgi:hypothetical protein
LASLVNRLTAINDGIIVTRFDKRAFLAWRTFACCGIVTGHTDTFDANHTWITFAITALHALNGSCLAALIIGTATLIIGTTALIIRTAALIIRTAALIVAALRTLTPRILVTGMGAVVGLNIFLVFFNFGITAAITTSKA